EMGTRRGEKRRLRGLEPPLPFGWRGELPRPLGLRWPFSELRKVVPRSKRCPSILPGGLYYRVRLHRAHRRGEAAEPERLAEIESAVRHRSSARKMPVVDCLSGFPPSHELSGSGGQ